MFANGGDYVLQYICVILLHKQFCSYRPPLFSGTEGTMLKMTACQIGQNTPVVVGVEE